MFRNVGDSVIVGLVAIRVLRGRVLSRVLNSIVMAFVTFSVLTRSSKRISKTIEVEATEERLVALEDMIARQWARPVVTSRG